MVTLPTYQRRQLLDTDRGGMPQHRPDAGKLMLADAISGLSNAGMNLISRLQQREQEKEEEKTAVAFRQLNQNDKEALTSSLQNMSPDGEGLFEDFQGNLNNLHAEFYNGLSPRMQEKYRDRLALLADQWEYAAANAEYDQGQKYANTQLTDALNARLIELGKDPDSLDAIRAAGEQDIDEIGARLSPTDREAHKRAWQINTWLEQQNALSGDPEYAAARIGADAGYYAAIRQAESGGNDSAKNPNSSATGRYQFIKETWDGLVDRFPGSGLTKDGRTDPEQQEIAIRLFTAENKAALQKAGIEATYGNLYAAHFLGAGGAVKVLSASDGESIASLVNSSTMTANPFLKGMTVGDFKAWAARKTNVDADMPEGVTPEQYASIQNYASAVTTQEGKDRKESYDLAIVTGQLRNPEVFLNDPFLDDGEKATLFRAYETANKDFALVDALRNNPGPINTFDSDQVRAANKLFESNLAGTTPEQRTAVAQEHIEKYGAIPDMLLNELRSQHLSSDPNDIMAAMEAANYYASAAERHFQHFDGHDAIQKDLDIYNAKRGLHFSQEEAAQEVLDRRDPDKQQTRARIMERADVKKAIEGVNASEVLGVLNGPGFNDKPQEFADEIAAVGDYRQILEDSIIDANGDVDLGKKMANDLYKKLYGTSAYLQSGDRTVIKNPFELRNPPVNGSWDYGRGQALAALLEQGDGTSDLMDQILAGKVAPISPEDVYLQPNALTEEYRRAGSPYIPYDVFYMQDGQLQTVMQPFVAIPEEAEAPMPDFTEDRERRDRRQLADEYRQEIIRGSYAGPWNEWVRENHPEMEGQPPAPEKPDFTDQGVQREMEGNIGLTQEDIYGRPITVPGLEDLMDQ